VAQVGSFEMAPVGKKGGPPAPVKKLLGLFGSQREEDRLAGYLSFLKVGPKILKFLPMRKAQDLRSWCGASPAVIPAIAAQRQARGTWCPTLQAPGTPNCHSPPLVRVPVSF
jgi:Domain of unknown function (DUF3479)